MDQSGRNIEGDLIASFVNNDFKTFQQVCAGKNSSAYLRRPISNLIIIDQHFQKASSQLLFWTTSCVNSLLKGEEECRFLDANRNVLAYFQNPRLYTGYNTIDSVCDVSLFLSCIGDALPVNRGNINFDEIIDALLLIINTVAEREGKWIKYILRSCMFWYTKRLPSYERIVKAAFKNFIPAYLRGSKGIQIKHIYRLSDALLLNTINEDPEILALLKKAITSKSFLVPKFGLQFIFSCFHISQTISEEFFETVKDDMLHYPQQIKGSKFGEIYFTIWDTGSVADKEVIFTQVKLIADLWSVAPRTQRKQKTKTGKTLFDFLRWFHVEEVLVDYPTELYDYKFWKKLKSVNATVRANVAEILFDTFPIISRRNSFNGRKILSVKYFIDEAINLLYDESCDQVRLVATMGISGILSKHLNTILDDQLEEILDCLSSRSAVEDHKYISTAALNCLIKFVKANKLNHLDKCIPKKVLLEIDDGPTRLKYVEFLHTLWKVDSNNFFQLSGLTQDEMLQSLLHSSPKFQEQIVAIISKKYFSFYSDPSEFLQQTVKLLLDNEDVALIYLRALAKISLDRCATYMKIMWNCILRIIEHPQIARNMSIQNFNLEDGKNVLMLFECLIFVWEGVKSHLCYTDGTVLEFIDNVLTNGPQLEEILNESDWNIVFDFIVSVHSAYVDIDSD